MLDRIRGIVGRIHHLEILLVDHALAHQLLSEKMEEFLPVSRPRSIQTNDGTGIRLSGLDQSQGFKTFIMGPESSGTQECRVGFPEEHEFAREEILEGHKLWVPEHHGVGFLLERKLDVQAKTLLVARAFIPRLHDP